jgi:general L-amino acid transport system permease protein
MAAPTASTLPDAPPLERPPTRLGARQWLRQNLFHTWFDALLTVLVVLVGVGLGYQFFRWVIVEAQWAIVTDNFRGLMQGLYPINQGWRVAIAVLIATLLAGASWAVWGRMFFGSAMALLGAALIVLALPAIDRSMWDSSTLGYYIDDELIPLLSVLRMPIVILVACLTVGYGCGRLLRAAVRQNAGRVIISLWLVSIPLTFVLVRGLAPDSAVLPAVPTNQWGGLLLTFMLAFVAIVCCFPLGVLLALGRASGAPTPYLPLPARWWLNPIRWGRVAINWWRSQGNYPIIKVACVLYIELLRGVPLVTVFFAANYIVPFALGIPSSEMDTVVRAMVALTLFEAAYIAEIVRGGLQALPPGQMEAAKALGLSSIQSIGLIILPQALRLVIPALVGQFITMFKDTSLVVLVGLLDLLGTAQSVLAKPEYSEHRREILVFVAIVYFVFSYGMSRAAQQLERSGPGRLRKIG